MTAGHDEIDTYPGLVDWLEERDVRYEIIDGMVVVSPPPTITHERLVMRVITALHGAVISGTEVFSAGLKVFYRGAWYLYPDVSVVRIADADLEDQGMIVPPLLVVEVLSPSTRRKDLLLKREIYAEFGIATYWLLDPPRRLLTVLTLQDGAYVETAQGSRLELDAPYPVVIDLT